MINHNNKIDLTYFNSYQVILYYHTNKLRLNLIIKNKKLKYSKLSRTWIVVIPIDKRISSFPNHKSKSEIHR